MPTLPMLTPATHPNDPRGVTAPGGYECWHFDAASDDGQVHLIAELHAGFALDPRYLRAYERYRRSPTRRLPPVPADHAAVALTVLERGRPIVRLVSRVPRGEFEASANGRGVRLGASHINRGADGGMSLHLRGTRRDETVTANLAFRPHVRADKEVTLSPCDSLVGGPSSDSSAGEHGWVIVDPLCDVDGEIAIYDGAGAAPRSMTFAGSGYHDHRYGTRPMYELAERWFCGRVLFDDRAIAFCRTGDTSHICETRGGACTTDSRELCCKGNSLTRWGLSYPESIELAGDVQLVRPRVIESTVVGVRVAYDAIGEAQTGAALCEVTRPRRLTSAVIGRWMQWVWW